MAPQAPRLKDIASALGLSITTVSRALAGYADVGPDTRDRVKACADAMGYIPSKTGRMLVSGRTDFIGMVLPVRHGHLIDAFLGEFIVGLGDGLTRHRRDLFLATAAEHQTEVEIVDHIVRGARADALVINRTKIEDGRVRYLIDRGFPFVAHGRVPTETRPYVWFDTDGEEAFGRAVRMLLDLGHRRFGFFGIVETYTFAHYRRTGAELALKRVGMSLDPAACAEGSMYDEDATASAADRLIDTVPRPTAFLCATDTLALALMKSATRQGLKIPRDLSIIGFDDVPISAWASPPLTTFDQKARKSAATVADMVIGVLHRVIGPDDSRLIEAELVSRASHGPAPTSRKRRVGQ